MYIAVWIVFQAGARCVFDNISITAMVARGAIHEKNGMFVTNTPPKQNYEKHSTLMLPCGSTFHLSYCSF